MQNFPRFSSGKLMGERRSPVWASGVELSLTWLILILWPARARPRVKTLVISQHLSASSPHQSGEIISPVSYSEACWLAVLRVIEWDVVLNTHYGPCITGLSQARHKYKNTKEKRNHQENIFLFL